MKKLFSTFMAALLAASLLCAAPALAEDPAGTVIVDVRTPEEAAAGFSTSANIYDGTAASHMYSSLTGYNEKRAIVMTAATGTEATNHCTWKPGTLSSTQAYEVFVYNVGAGEENYRMNTAKAIAERDPSAKYTINGANGAAVRYINQGTATGTTNDWVSLGTYMFSGTDADYVKVEKIANPGWEYNHTYVSAVKFVPVTMTEAKLLQTYLSITKTVEEAPVITEIQKDETAVEGDRIVKRIPADATAYTVSLSAAPGSTVTVDGEEKTQITGTPMPGTVETHTVTVTAGSSTKTYSLALDMESATAFTIETSAGTVSTAGGTISFASPLTTEQAGYYNVYIQTGAASGANGQTYIEKMSVDIWHAGLRENVVLDYGRHAYHGSTWEAETWAYAGKYYFYGPHSQWNASNYYLEKIVVTNVQSGSGTVLQVPSVKLVAAEADPTAEPLAGVTLTASGKPYGVSLSAFDENNEYTLSAAAGESIGVMPVTNNTSYDRLTISGTNATLCTNVWPAVSKGVTRIPIEIIKGNKTETYTVILHMYNATTDVKIAGYQANDGSGGTKGDLQMLINADGNAIQSVKDGYIQFTPSLPETGKYRIIAWQPAFTAEGKIIYGSKNQPIEINTAAGPVSITKDWQSLPSKYVDLGVYDLGTDAYVKMTKAADADYLMVDTMYFIRQTPIVIDTVSITEDELEGYAYTTMNDSINLTASISPYMKVGDLVLESGVITNIPLSMGENAVTITVYSDAAYKNVAASHTFRVLCTAKTVGTEAEGVTETGTWAPSVKAGYAAGRSAKYTEEGGTLFFPAELWGDYEVFVWRVADSAAFSAAVNGNESAVAAGAAEWVSLGEYTFSGAETEGVTVTAAAGSAVYIDAVRFVPKGDYIFASAAVEAMEGGYAASFIGTKNTEGTETLRVMVAVYSGNQMKDITVESKTVSRGLFEFSDIFVAASEGDTVKAFLWSGLTPVYQTIKKP